MGTQSGKMEGIKELKMGVISFKYQWAKTRIQTALEPDLNSVNDQLKTPDPLDLGFFSNQDPNPHFTASTSLYF